MKGRKMYAMILAVLLLTVSLFGCGQNPEDNDDVRLADSEAMENKSMENGAKDKLTGIVKMSAQSNDLDTMEWMKIAMERADVDIEWQEVREGDWEEVKGTMLASGDIPDLIIGADNFNASDFVTFDGLFMDLSGLLDNAQNIQKMFTDHPDLKVLATNEKGEIFGIPKYQRWWPQSWFRQYINKQWLDTLGLEVPETWNDLYEVLKAFKEKDPNGNGKADEIPYAFFNRGSEVLDPYMFLSNFGITFDLSKSGNGFYVQEGKVKNYLGSDEFKQLAIYCHKLYQEGLIYSSSFTQNDAAWVAMGRSGEADKEATYGYIQCWVAADIVGDTLKDQYIAIPPLKVHEEQKEMPLWTNEYEMLNIKPIAAVVSSECKNPEAAVRFLDALYEPEMSLAILFGDIGSKIKKNDDGSYTVLSPSEAGDTSGINAGGWKWKVTLADYGPGCIDDEMIVDLPQDLVEVNEDGIYQTEIFSQIDTKNNLLHEAFLKFSEDELSQLALIKTNIQSLASPQFTDWVVNGGIDEGWDTYLQSLQATGVDEAIKIYQSSLDDFLKE